MTRPGPRVMAAHVSALCRKHGIQRTGSETIRRYIEAPKGVAHLLAAGCAHLERRLVHYPTITGPRGYYTAMHELGHLVLNHSPNPDPPPPVWWFLGREADANVWAKDNMLPGSWTAACTRFREKALATYLKVLPDLRDQYDVGMLDFLPPHGHTFWAQAGVDAATVQAAAEKSDLEWHGRTYPNLTALGLKKSAAKKISVYPAGIPDVVPAGIDAVLPDDDEYEEA